MCLSYPPVFPSLSLIVCPTEPWPVLFVNKSFKKSDPDHLAASIFQNYVRASISLIMKPDLMIKKLKPTLEQVIIPEDLYDEGIFLHINYY